MNKTPMERWRKWRETHDRKNREQRYNADAYQRRVQQGRCGHCGAARPEGYEYATCIACRNKCKLAQEQRRAEMDLEAPDADERPSSELVRCSRCHLVLPHDNCLGGSALDRREW